jgi:inosine-uridine nucleoside N-ribohydrolase
MQRKVIIDCDPGIDDAVAVCMALFDPRLDVLALTACAGTIDADRATHNLQAIVERLDPPRIPRLGAAQVVEDGPVLDDADLHGPDGLAGCNFEVSDRQHRVSSEKVISELIRKHPGEITIICLGPLTNLAKALQRDPTLTTSIDKVVISGGSVTAPGNVTAAAEFNMFFDPPSARRVLQSPLTKCIVPLDVTASLTFGLDLLEALPSKHSRAGSLLHRWLPFAFRTRHQRLGSESLPLYDPVALVAAIEPDLFRWETMAGDVEINGELTRGATIFDRRARPQWRSNMDVAISLHEERVRREIFDSLGRCDDPA